MSRLGHADAKLTIDVSMYTMSITTSYHDGIAFVSTRHAGWRGGAADPGLCCGTPLAYGLAGHELTLTATCFRGCAAACGNRCGTLL